MADTSDLVTLERRDDGVAVLTLNNPKVNALSGAVLRALRDRVGELEADLPGAVVVTGGDRIFAAGAEISEFGGPDEARSYGGLFLDTFNRLAALPRMTIAAIAGYALGGGCELALACDFIVASEKAVFGQPEVNLGICPGFGGTQRLTRVVGKSMALELVTTGRTVKADEALRIGLANHVAAPEALLDKGLELARMIAAKGPVAVRFSKHLVVHGQDMDLANANTFEADVFAVLCATDDKREGMAAFLEKRPPKFVGR